MPTGQQPYPYTTPVIANARATYQFSYRNPFTYSRQGRTPFTYARQGRSPFTYQASYQNPFTYQCTGSITIPIHCK